MQELGKFLPATTWKKINDFETITFLDEKRFMYKNYLTKEKLICTYTLGYNLGEMTILWAMDNFKADSLFTENFTQFTELHNPNYLWKLVG